MRTDRGDIEGKSAAGTELEQSIVHLELGTFAVKPETLEVRLPFYSKVAMASESVKRQTGC